MANYSLPEDCKKSQIKLRKSGDLSLIPVLGTLSCLYLMSEIDHLSWMRFGVWLLIGLVIYFGYSIKRSKLNSKDLVL
ncbi:MAG: hypothetical protein H6605_01420 [Flavobacteriales bacterium]|nr:hypothetical protein [Flavobacteriales bacterium]